MHKEMERWSKQNQTFRYWDSIDNPYYSLDRAK